jgi:hypothetical protein
MLVSGQFYRSTHSIGGYGAPGTDAAEKVRISFFYQNRDPISRTFSPYPVAIPAEIPWLLPFVKDRAGLKGERLGLLPRGLNKTATESTYDIFDSLKSWETLVYIFSYYKK